MYSAKKIVTYLIRFRPKHPAAENVILLIPWTPSSPPVPGAALVIHIVRNSGQMYVGGTLTASLLECHAGNLVFAENSCSVSSSPSLVQSLLSPCGHGFLWLFPSLPSVGCLFRAPSMAWRSLHPVVVRCAIFPSCCTQMAASDACERMDLQRSRKSASLSRPGWCSNQRLQLQ